MEDYEDQSASCEENWQAIQTILAREPDQVGRRSRDGAAGVLRHRRGGLVRRLERDCRRPNPGRIYGLHGGDVFDVWSV